MDIVYSIAGTPIPNRVNFLKEGGSFVTAAFRGEIGTGGIRIEDPLGNLTINGWQIFTVRDMDATPTMVWQGYINDRTQARGTLGPAGAARVHDCDLIDGNFAWQFQVLHLNDAKRPAETDVERVTWLPTSEALDAYGNVLFQAVPMISSTDPVDFLATDCRGQFANAVLRTLAEISNKNFFPYIDEGTELAGLFYGPDDEAVYSSTIRISNVIADEDGTTTFYPNKDAELHQSAADRYSGVLFNWQGDPIYAQSPSTITSMGGIVRDAVVSDDKQIGDAATAAIEAEAFLNSHATEAHTIRCSILMPSESVTLLRAGHRMQVKFTHLEGYESFTWTRVRRMGVHPVGADVEGTWTVLWQADLELWVPPVPVDDATPIGEECVPEASIAQVQDFDPNGTGPSVYDFIWSNTGDDAHGGYAPEPLVGQLAYYLPVGTGATGIEATGTGDLTCTLVASMASVQSGTYTAEFQITKNGTAVLAEAHSTSGGLRFESWNTSPLVGVVSVVAGDILAIRYIDSNPVGIATFPAGTDFTTFTVEGDLCDVDSAEVPLPEQGDPVGPEVATGDVDAVNDTFTSPTAAAAGGWLPGTLTVLHDGTDQTAHVLVEDTVAGAIQLDYAPEFGATIRLRYASA